MYILLLVLLLTPGLVLCWRGFRAQSPTRVAGGVLAICAGLLPFAWMSFEAEWLWFEYAGFESRFWRLIGVTVGLHVAALIVAAAFAMTLAWRAGTHLRRVIAGVAGLIGLVWANDKAEPFLLWWYGEAVGHTEPVLGFDVAFYLFNLPFFDALFGLAFVVSLLTLVGVLFVWESPTGIRFRHFEEPEGSATVVPIANAGFALVLAGGMLLACCHLLYSKWGVVQGPGWVDVHVLLPALLVGAVAMLLVAAAPLLPAFRVFMLWRLGRWLHTGRPAIAAMVVVWSAIGALALVCLVVVPVMVQWLVVKPNEISFEKPWIVHNIDFTRRGFRLDAIEERAFVPSPDLTRATVANNRQLLSEVRLWDWRALDAVYRQFQEIRLYYEFSDVDIDRYRIGDRYRQVMVSARELGQHNLPEQSRTFVNQRFKYTHGYGYTAAAVSDFTPEGLPNLLVQDIPPVAAVPELAVTEPRIYYGELTDEAAVVNTLEEEFDYPSGDSNVYTRYQGKGGVPLEGFWRKFLFGWKLDGSVLLFSSYPTAESRVMFHRQIEERVAKLAPFLTLDADPYLVNHDGRLYWIIDAYTQSDYYPYSQPFDSRQEGSRTVRSLEGATWVRNAAKVVVDAYQGTVDFYVFDDGDPLIKAWNRAFPNMFHGRDDMPEGLREHVRYPVDFLLVQGLTFSKYHMSDPEVFYNQEDLWVRATEKHYGNVVPVQPYYVMWELPDSDEAEFVLILPFTPKNKQVLIGWIAGLSDGDNYGRFLAYSFPKERRMLGPQQVETKIDQDSFLSGQLTLWDQQGSEVIRGNVLAIPLDDTLIYVEPIYLRAETAAYPELRLVAVMHGDRLSYAETFDEALEGLFDDEVGSAALHEDGSRVDIHTLATRAAAAFDAYLAAQGAGRFQEAAAQLARLQQLLKAMASGATDAS